MSEAACLEIGTEAFFIDNEPNTVNKVKQVCNGCPVRMDCLDYALSDTSLVGIFGGTTEKERRRLRRRARA